MTDTAAPTLTYHIGDALTVLQTLETGSVDLLLSSPPFLALRSYLPADHPDKPLEGGSQATPGAYLDWLLDVTEECRRVLAPHGSLCFELGDTYAGSGGAGGDYAEGGLRDGQARFDGSASKAYGTGAAARPARVGRLGRDRNRKAGIPESGGGHGWPLDKSLTLVPETFRFALAYGRNPFTGRETPKWRIRNVIRWVRPNPPVGALADKFRPGTSEMLVACTSRKRYFDLDAVRGAPSPNTHARTAAGVDRQPTTGKAADDERRGGNFSTLDTLHTIAGAPPLDWWQISTAPYKGSHYATWPPELCIRPILAMTPPRVCLECGTPSKRINEDHPDYAARRSHKDIFGLQSSKGEEALSRSTGRQGGSCPADITSAERVTLGWSDCDHGDNWRPGVVLDPFAGTFTTGLVAHGHGRSAIGIDLDPRNVELAQQRLGPLTHINVVDHGAAEAST